MAGNTEPIDGNYRPLLAVVSPGNGLIVPQAGSTVLTDASSGQQYAPLVVQQAATASVNGTLQNAAGANGNGTLLALLGSASIIFTVTQTGFTGVVNFECTEDNSNWDPLQVQQEGTNTIATTVTGSTTTVTHLYEASVAGLQSIRARVSGFSAGTVTVTAHAIPTTDASRVVNSNIVSPYPANATPITAASGDVAAATAAATLAAATGKTTYITGFSFTSTGSTGASTVDITITNTITGTLTFVYVSVAGATTANTNLNITFPYPIPASATNTTIVASCPTLGAGNLHAAMNAYGFQL